MGLKNRKILLRYGLLGHSLKVFFSITPFKNSFWKWIIPTLSLLFPSIGLLFLITGKVKPTPVILMVLVAFVYGISLRKNIEVRKK